MKHTLARALCTVAMLGASHAGAQVAPERLAEAAREGVVVVYAATDESLARPLVQDFEARHPGVRVEYHDMQSGELYRRFVAEATEGGGPDVVWSSAMDLQVKLVNDGHAQPYRSVETAALPPWAIWKNEAFGTTYEPIAIVYNKRSVPPEAVPHTHAELARLLGERPQLFRARVATYDPERSGLGFLLHTQDVQTNAAAFWQLARAIGTAGVRQHRRTSDMLEEIAAGTAAIGYNMLGSYAYARAETNPALGVVLPRDYTLVMSRVAFISRKARHPAAARLWLDYLLSSRGQNLLAENAGLFSVREDAASGGMADLRTELGSAFRPIAIGPGLLTWIDQSKRRDFLRRWEAAMQGR